jgi:hypothetical protein
MSFAIPDNDVAGNANQSLWFSTDIAILAAGLAGTGVISGCAVTAQGSPDMTLAVSSGYIQATPGTVPVPVAAGNVSITAASATDPRIDLVTTSAAGVKTVTDGTAAVSPKPPALPSGHVALAMVYVAANDAAINTGEITSKRVVLASSKAVKHLTGDETGKTDANLVDTSLSFAVLNGVYYAFRFYVAWRTSVVSVGLKIGLTTPAFTVYSAVVRTIFAADGSDAVWEGALTTSGDSVIGTAAPVIGTDYLTVIEGVILPSADGVLMVQYAAETTGATVTMRQGSAGELVRV